MLITKKRIGNYSSHFKWQQHRWTETTKKIVLVMKEGSSHRHIPKSLEMGRTEIGCYIGNKANNIHSHKKERHTTYCSVLLGKLNKGNGQRYGGNPSGTTNPK